MSDNIQENIKQAFAAIPGHCNYDGNEEAYRLAREGLALIMTSSEAAVGLLLPPEETRLK